MRLKKNNTVVLKLMIIGLFIIWSCKGKKADTILSQPPQLTEDFTSFYEKYSTDSIFQLEHTVFPLEGIKAPESASDMIDPNFKWTPENWVIQKKFDDNNGTFTREFYNLNGVIVEKISDNSGTFTMERRFGKLSSGWHLIYYRELGMYGKKIN